MSERTKNYVVLAARALIASVFLFAAVPKLIDPRAFAEAIANYHLVPDAVSSVSAAILPVMEIVVACALILGMKERGAALVGALMLLFFAGAMISTITRGINLDCGCFGAAAEAQVGWTAVGRNALLMLVALYVAVRPHAPWRP